MTSELRFSWVERARLFDRLRWHATPDDEPRSRTLGKIAIVGMPGMGKKTLLNTLWGWNAVEDSGESVRNFGLITVIDLPEDATDAASVMYRLEGAELILFVLDASQPLRTSDFSWITRLRGLNGTLVIAAGRFDQVESAARKITLTTLRDQTACPVVPLVSTNPTYVHAKFIPAVLRLCPTISLSLAGEIQGLKKRVLLELILRSALTSLITQLQMSTDEDSSLLMEVQAQMVKRIATLYGHKDNSLSHIQLVLHPLLRMNAGAFTRIARWFPRHKGWSVSVFTALGSTVVAALISVIYFAYISGAGLDKAAYQESPDNAGGSARG